MLLGYLFCCQIVCLWTLLRTTQMLFRPSFFFFTWLYTEPNKMFSDCLITSLKNIYLYSGLKIGFDALVQISTNYLLHINVCVQPHCTKINIKKPSTILSMFLMNWCWQGEKQSRRETYCGWKEIAELVRVLSATLIPPSHFSCFAVCSPAALHKFRRSFQAGTHLTFHFCVLDSGDRRSVCVVGG